MHERFYAGPFSEVRTRPDRLAVPTHWRKPRVCFVCNTSDLFHPAVPFEFIEEVFTIMLISSLHDTRFGHTFLIASLGNSPTGRCLMTTVNAARAFCINAIIQRVSMWTTCSLAIIKTIWMTWLQRAAAFARLENSTVGTS